MSRSLTISLVILAVLLILFAATRRDAASAVIAPIPDPATDQPLASQSGHETLVLGGGCFWGVQAVFKHVKGVTQATAGYAGGTVKNPDYESVSTGVTGHAESVEILYDPSQITLGTLLKVFFSVVHDPTQLNRQGPDTGTQYRSAIFFTSSDQQRIAQAYIDQLNQAKIFSRPIVTQVVPLAHFYRAEEYHQDFAAHHPDNPYIAMCDLPKLKKFREEFPSLYVAKP